MCFSKEITGANNFTATTVSAISQTTAKPRLIAKTGASLRDTPKSRLGPESASGPDASKVWNKNRRKSRKRI